MSLINRRFILTNDMMYTCVLDVSQSLSSITVKCIRFRLLAAKPQYFLHLVSSDSQLFLYLTVVKIRKGHYDN